MTVTPEFSYCVKAADVVSTRPYTLQFEADARACELLAKRFQFLEIRYFKGQAVLTRSADGTLISVEGTFDAHVTQACISTLEPVPETVKGAFEGYFSDESQISSFVLAKKRRARENGHADEDVDPEEGHFIDDEKDAPEPVIGGLIDVGELAAQYLSLAVNPYPQTPEALAAKKNAPEPEATPGPFDALKNWKA